MSVKGDVDFVFGNIAYKAWFQLALQVSWKNLKKIKKNDKIGSHIWTHMGVRIVEQVFFPSSFLR